MSYVDAAYYEELARAFSAWPEREHDAPAVREECRQLVYREARLLDEQRFDDWLAMYSAQCLYWIPARPGGDPRREVAVAFDDRRRLEDRVFRLRTGYAWSQTPASRTVRLVSNVQVFAAGGTSVLVRSNFLVADYRAGEMRFWSGWCGHRIRRGDGGGEIEVRQVNLVNCDANLRNPSLLL